MEVSADFAKLKSNTSSGEGSESLWSSSLSYRTTEASEESKIR